MHDIRSIRDNPELFDAGLARRGVEPVAAALLALDADKRGVSTRMQEAQNRRNEASKAIGAAKAQKRARRGRDRPGQEMLIHPGIEARAFIRPAFDRHIEDALEIQRTTLSAAIDKALR